MSSNFFEQQDIARRRTGYLVALFIAAVLGISLLLYGLVLAVYFYTRTKLGQSGAAPPYFEALAVTVLGVLAVVGSCSIYKILSLRSGGGQAVAQMMGGRLLVRETADANERKVLNVVEEMALASGTAVPPVYLMDNEGGINAFAAGYTPDSAVIGVTRGAIEQLSRNELQGVIAHEFSHIFNGDMRLNIRLMGVIFGLIAIAIIGRVMFRMALHSGGSHRRSSGNKRDGSGVMVFLAVGLGLMIIGGLGVLFGQLIQAAVSRQREYLADASAVQFTRNPESIGGALKRIGGYSSFVSGSGHAGEIGHMFIAKHGNAWTFGPFATHPPIEDRIRRIDPSWDGKFPEPRQAPPPRYMRRELEPPSPPIPLVGDERSPLGGFTGAVVGTAIAAEAAKLKSQPAIDSIGTVSATHIDYMRSLLAEIPAALRSAAHEAYGARAVVYVVLLDKQAAVREKQLAYIDANTDSAVAKLTRGLAVHIQHLAKEARLPLVDMAVPALRQMSDAQYGDFKRNVLDLIKADGRVDLFEWALQRLLLRHLDSHYLPGPDPSVRYYSLKPVAGPCAVVLSALAHLGHRDENESRSAFSAGASELGIDGLSQQARDTVKFEALGQALDDLAQVSPREKRKLVRACARSIAADGKVTRGEGELMRAVADSLGVPMPPLLPGQVLV